MILVPEDVKPAGVIRAPAAVMAIGLALSPLSRIWRKPLSAIDPLNVVAAAPVYWLLLDPIQGAYDLPNLGQSVVRSTFAAVGLFSGGVWLAAFHRPWFMPRAIQQSASMNLAQDKLFAIAVLAFVLAFLRFAIPSGFDLELMWNVLFESRWAAPWGRGSHGGWNAFLDHFAYFGYVLPSLVVLLGRAAGWLNWKTLMVLGFAIVIGSLLAAGGGRRIVGVFIGSGFVVWFLSARRPSLKHLFVLVCFCGVLLGLLQFMLLYRAVGIGHAFDSSSNVQLHHPGYLHVDDNFLRTSQIIDIIPEHHDYVTWRWLIWVAARPVPRVFWPGKPVDPGFSLHGYLGAQGVSYSSSIVGELYMAFGFFGCLFGGWFWGRISMGLRSLLATSRSSGSLVVFSAGLFAVFVGVRSGIELVLMGYGVLAWVGLVWIYRQTGMAGRTRAYIPGER